MILTVGIQLRSRQFHKKWLSSSTIILAVLAALMVGCQPKEPTAQRTEKTSQSGGEQANSDRGTLPSMSSYISEGTTGKPAQSKQNKPADGLPENAKENAKAGTSAAGTSAVDSALSAGQQYCFYKAGNQNWLGIRLQVTDDQQITGKSAGTVNSPQKGEAHYQQTFTGKITGDQALVEVTTHIAGATQSRQEAWTVTPQQLDMKRIVIEKASCMKVSPVL